jgi:hypothetical protein
MSVPDSALELAGHLPKVVSPRTHGAIDYAHAALFLGMAALFRKRNKAAAVAALCTGTYLLAQSLLTDYPMGAAKIIPFELHGKMDAGFASASWVIPKIFGFRDKPEAKLFEMNTVLETTVIGMTDFNGNRARMERHA